MPPVAQPSPPKALTALRSAASWAALWQALGAAHVDAGLRKALLSRWNEPGRHYHTTRHLGECLRHFAAVRGEAQHAAEIELALWFHDAIYDLQAHDNERRSADWAQSAALAAGVAHAAAARVHALVMATCHDAAPASHDEALMVDVDLAILGADARRFAQYEQQVRREYAWVPQALYRQRRAAVLQGFLDRPRLYTSGHFFDTLEARARCNLRQSIRQLTH